MQLKFSPANAKTHALYEVPELQKFLADKRKVYSLDTRSGYTCPAARKCFSRAIELPDGKRKIKDGKFTEFRCFSASQEVLHPNVYNARKHNEMILRSLAKGARLKGAKEISSQLPRNLGVLRWHVGGGVFNQTYFDIMALVARLNPEKLFYAYLKNLPCWIRRRDELTDNFVLTASYGGEYDSLIESENLRSAKVVFSEQEASDLGLPLDHTDEYAANPANRNTDFALLLHNSQPKGTPAAKAWQKIKKTTGGYKK